MFFELILVSFLILFACFSRWKTMMDNKKLTNETRITLTAANEKNSGMKWKKQVMQGGCPIPPTKPKGRPKKNSIPSLGMSGMGIEATQALLTAAVAAAANNHHQQQQHHEQQQHLQQQHHFSFLQYGDICIIHQDQKSLLTEHPT